MAEVHVNGNSRHGAMPVVLDTRVVSGTGGGPDKTILNSPRFLAQGGYRMLCAYMHPPNDPGFEQLRRRAAALQAPLLSIPDRGPLDWRVLAAMLRICRRERVQVWHGHDYKSNALGLLLRPFWPMRLVTTVHGWVKYTRRTPLYYAIDRFCLRRYEKVICVSEDLYRACRDCGVPQKRCVLIENGIDTRQYARRLELAAAKRRLGIPPERLVVGAVGRLSAEKGFDLLIHAVDRLLAEGIDAELLIAGEGDQEAPLRELAARLGRGERIRLLGYCPDPHDVYEAMDVFALSSLREGLPNVVLEAMAMEVPVLSTRIAGVPRLIRDGVNGLLIEPGSVDALTSALARLLRDEDLRLRLRQAGRRTVEVDYSFAVRMEKMRALYDSLLNRGH
jgi:glycosyltransferase involved in cell wall biosynthesis